MIEALNTDCFCVSLDREALRQAIDDDPAARGLSALIEERCPHLFAALPVYGVQAWVLAPEQLTFRDGELRDANGPIDLVYNRMTDFSLQEAAHAALRAAYLAGAAVVTPHPRAHALYADKRNLAVLSDESRLAALGVRREAIEVLLRGVPRTRLVTAALAEELWADRRKLFFKPAAGFGSKAAYRGDKLTRRVWSEVQAGIHVAQELIPHPRRRFCSGAHHGRRIPHRRSRWRRSISRQS